MEKPREVEVTVAGIVLDPASNAPIVILKATEGEAALPIWIGMAEATAIATAIKGMPLPRPMTHDLLRNIIEELGGRVLRIVITSLRDATFIATIEIAVGESFRVIDARPSDAIALAVRVGARVFVHPEVLAQAQVTLVDMKVPSEDQMQAAGEKLEPDDNQLEDRNFAGIDKDKWADILAGMDPDDFKYKM